jgi:hypothetical protein
MLVKVTKMKFKIDAQVGDDNCNTIAISRIQILR